MSFLGNTNAWKFFWQLLCFTPEQLNTWSRSYHRKNNWHCWFPGNPYHMPTVWKAFTLSSIDRMDFPALARKKIHHSFVTHTQSIHCLKCSFLLPDNAHEARLVSFAHGEQTHHVSNSVTFTHLTYTLPVVSANDPCMRCWCYLYVTLANCPAPMAPQQLPSPIPEERLLKMSKVWFLLYYLRILVGMSTHPHTAHLRALLLRFFSSSFPIS